MHFVMELLFNLLPSPRQFHISSFFVLLSIDWSLLKLFFFLVNSWYHLLPAAGRKAEHHTPVSIPGTLCKHLLHTPPTLWSSICLASQHRSQVKTWRQLPVSSSSVFRQAVRVSFHSLIRFCSLCWWNLCHPSFAQPTGLNPAYAACSAHPSSQVLSPQQVAQLLQEHKCDFS